MVTIEQPARTALRDDPATEIGSFMRAADAFYARLAAERGEAYVHIGDDEIGMVGAFAAALGVMPADAEARMPARFREASAAGVR